MDRLRAPMVSWRRSRVCVYPCQVWRRPAGRRAVMSSIRQASQRTTRTDDMSKSNHVRGKQTDHRPVVVRSSLYAAGGFATAIVSLVVGAANAQISDGTVRFALAIVGVIAASAQCVAAVYVLRR